MISTLKNLVIFKTLFLYGLLFPQHPRDIHTINHNKIEFPFNRNGKLADVRMFSPGMVPGPAYRYDSKEIVFSAGFLLTGKKDESIWVNGMASGHRIEDYMSGSFLNEKYNSLSQIFVVKKDDLPFSESWQNWKNAVKLGANYYDGNNNGKYDPEDLNGNGKWDKNEDRPELIGEETAWCVYKDDVSSDIRRFKDQKPKGIEIQQTIYVTNRTKAFENTIFIRYKIINSGLISEEFDSVYFSVYADPDIGSNNGDYTKDLIGCDTVLNSGFAYKRDTSFNFGDNPPCFLVDIINGPISYIPNETFLDKNNNYIFDEGEVVLDSAYNIYGNVMGPKTTYGARNLRISSFIGEYFSSFYPSDGEATDFINYIHGKPFGSVIDPCDLTLSTIFNQDCKNIDGKFLYSGDPVYLDGWICNKESDQYFHLNTGPFKLTKNKPIEITVAYIIGQGSSPLESIKVAKQYSREIQFLYNNNDFEEKETVIEIPPTEEKINLDFVLQPNFPNPFNNQTSISYSVRYSGNTSLKLYNSIGELIKTFFNEDKSPGRYNFTFEADNLSSGVYLLTLQQDAFISTQKLVILK